MKRLVLSTILSVCIFSALAQSGFMGKKFSLGYSFEVLPYLNWLNEKSVGPSNNGNYQDASFEMVTGHHLSLGATVTRRLELIAYAGIRNREINYLPYANFYIDGILVDVNTFKGLKAQETFYDFGFRRYFKKHVAPVGFYHQFIFGQMGLKFRDDSAQLRFTPGESSEEEIDTFVPTKTAKPVNFFRLTYGLGIKTMLSEFLFINAEGNTHFNLKPSESYESYGMNNPNYLSSILESNFNFHRRYDFKIGVGLLF